MSQKNILRENIPSWCELGMSEDGESIEIRVHRVAMEFIKSILNEQAPIIAALREDLKLPPFINPTEKIWGFGDILQETSEQRRNWTAWKCKLPQSEEKRVNHNRGYAVSATLNLLFLALQCEEEETDSLSLQFMVVRDFLSERGFHGGSLNVDVSPAFLHGVAKLSSDQRRKVEQTMKNAYHRMFYIPNRSLAVNSIDKFQVQWWASKWISLVCPGDACDLSPKYLTDPSLGIGYTLLSHNVDGPLQQLTILVGLAKLEEFARQSSNGTRGA